MSPMKRRSGCLTLLSLLVPTLSSESARAQDTAPLRLDKVEVVGSHLKRIDGEGAAPVSTYTRDDIEATGAARLGDFLLALPFAGAGGSDDRSTSFSPGLEGTAALSLRGLGPGATLVLLNGRRLAAYGLALFDNDETFVDLNSLPLAAVQRVEVLRDGASAIYGADAIGGVVNIVLRRDFSGAEAMARVGQSTRGDARRAYATTTWGAGDLRADGYNAFIALDAQRRDAVPMVARSFSRSADQRPRGGFDGRFPTSSPPTVQLPDGDPFAAPACPPDRVMPALIATVRGTFCGFDPNPYNPLVPHIERVGALAVGSAAPTADLRLYAELAVNRAVASKSLSPAPVATVVPADAPTNPFGQDALVLWRPLDAGSRRGETKVDLRRAVIGAQGAWRRWEWDVAAGSTTIVTEVQGRNELRLGAVIESVGTGVLNPFTPTNDPAALDAARAAFNNGYDGRNQFVHGKATTELTRLQHGPMALAIGAERRRESFATALDPLVIAGEINGVSQADSSATRGVGAVFAEVNWLPAADLEVQLAARHDRYSDFGSTTHPKVAVRWRPAKAIMMRASAGRGFLPPSLPQLNRPRSAGEGVFDPVRCPVTQSFDDCGGGTNVYSQQGNPDLDAERSRQINAGVVIEPFAGWSASLDVWRIVHTGKIVFGGEYILRNEAAFPGRVIRGPVTAEDAALGLPGAIVEFRDAYVNLASRDVRGVDIEMKGRVASVLDGALALGATVSYLDRFVERVTPLDAARDDAGGDGRPRLRASASTEWQRGPWQLGIAARYIGSYRYLQPIDEARRTVASWTVIDLNIAWRGPRDRVSLTLHNAADRDPPFRSIGVGYDYQAMHDPIGRFVSLAWRHSF
jgi:iron complex outermembrane receptor protein